MSPNPNALGSPAAPQQSIVQPMKLFPKSGWSLQKKTA
jgi:hypothetical protein